MLNGKWKIETLNTLRQTLKVDIFTSSPDQKQNKTKNSTSLEQTWAKQFNSQNIKGFQMCSRERIAGKNRINIIYLITANLSPGKHSIKQVKDFLVVETKWTKINKVGFELWKPVYLKKDEFILIMIL